MRTCRGWDKPPRAACSGVLPPALKPHTSIHKPLCEPSSTGFRQPYNVLQSMSWRAAKAVIRGNTISLALGLEKARNMFQKGVVVLKQNHRNRQLLKS